MKDRISSAECVELFSLGSLAVSDFVVNQPKVQQLHDMTLVYSPESKLLQLKETLDPKKMFGKYWYRSGTNQTMTNALKEIVNDTLKLSNQKSGLWLDIASNDCTLLKNVPDTFSKIGIDPSSNNCVNKKELKGIEVINDFFSKTSYQKSLPGLVGKKCSIITAIAMFYDLDNPSLFLNDVYDILEDDGLFVIQLSYTPLMVEQLEFGNLCFEHLCYYTLHSLKYLLDKCRFKIVDCVLNDVNGGSFRVYIQKDVASKNSFGSIPHNSVAAYRVQSMLDYENSIGANEPEYYLNFFKSIEKLKEQVVSFIKECKDEGKSVWVYAASTKGNTLLQYFGLDKTLIDGAADRSPYKHGLKTINTDISIFSEEFMRMFKPDYLLVLAWHFIKEFQEREVELINSGTKFIIPSPTLQII